MGGDTRQCALDMGAFLYLSRVEAAPGPPRPLEETENLPLHDIAITKIVWYMAYKRGVGRRAYIAQSSSNIVLQ